MSKKFNGVIKLDVRDSKADWTPYELKKPPEGAATTKDIVNGAGLESPEQAQPILERTNTHG